MGFVAAVLVVAGLAHGGARECHVPPRDLPDAAELQRLGAMLREYEARTHNLTVRLDGRIEPRSLASVKMDPTLLPTHGAFGVSRTGTAQLPFDEIEVKDGAEVRRLRVVKGTTRAQAQAAMDKERARWQALSPLARAIEAGDSAAARGALRALGSLPAPEPDGAGGWLSRTASHWSSRASEAHGDIPRQHAIAASYLAIMETLLAAGAGPRGEPADKVLHMLPYRLSDGDRTPGAFEVARRLMRNGHSVEPPLRPGDGAMDNAARRDDVEVVSLMLAHGRPSPEARNSALRAAVLNRSWHSALALLEAGADPNTPGESLLAASMSAPRKVLKAILAAGPDPNVVVMGGLTPLVLAMHDHDIMAELLALGADPNFVIVPERRTPLHFAVYSGWPSDIDASRHPQLRAGRRASVQARARSVELLVRHGARGDWADENGRTPIMLTTPKDDAIIAALLPTARAGANEIAAALEARNETLATELLRGVPEIARGECFLVHLAAAAGAATTVSALLAAGASPSWVTADDARSAHMAAASRGHVEALRVLLDRGGMPIDHATEAKVSEGDRDYVRAFGVLAGLPPPAIALIVEDMRRMNSGQTALMLAAANGHEAAVRLLLQRGADPLRRDGRGRTALDHARASSMGRGAIPILESAVRR